MRAAGVPAILRPLARRRAQGLVGQVAPATLSVTPGPGGALTLTLGKPRTLVPGGPSISETTDDGAAVQVRAAWQGPRLVVTHERSAGRSTDTYALDAQGRLTLDRQMLTTMRKDGETRSVPMRFRLVYDRVR